MPRVALATCVQLPEPDVDQDLILDAAAQAGLDLTLAPWDDPSVDWSSYDLTVIRSTWNYYERETAFRVWLANTHLRTRLWNPADQMLWNLHKGYLAELEAAGLPVVPTHFLRSGERGHLPRLVEEEGWDKFVVKPAVSAGSWRTEAFTSHELVHAERLVREIEAEGDALVQPYLKSVEDGGEIAMVWIDGQFTHGVVKNPRFSTDEESVSLAVTPSPEQLAAGQRVLDCLNGERLYARIDLMRADDGRWLLSEAELIEPSLFFRQHPPALERYIQAIAARV